MTTIATKKLSSKSPRATKTAKPAAADAPIPFRPTDQREIAMNVARAEADYMRAMLDEPADRPHWLLLSCLAHMLEGRMRQDYERTADRRLADLLERLGTISSEISDCDDRNVDGIPSQAESTARVIARDPELRAAADELADLSDASVRAFRVTWAQNRLRSAYRADDRITLSIPLPAQLRAGLELHRRAAA